MTPTPDNIPRQPQDHQMTKEEKRWRWVENNFLALNGKLDQLQNVIDSNFLHIAVLSRLAGVDAKKMVEEIRKRDVNYTFLAECVNEENRLNKEVSDKMVADAEKAKKELGNAGLIPEVKDTANESKSTEVVQEETKSSGASDELNQPKS